jgi:hypothetical protein
MTQETVGYVNLEWDCPKCGTRNPGTEKICVSCGAAQPQDVQFKQAAGQVARQDETLKKVAESGADIHCGFCGTRNPAGAEICSQCGADLKKGVRREAGKVIGAYQATPVRQIACPSCGQANAETVARCVNCGAPISVSPSHQSSAVPVGSKTGSRNNGLWIAGGVVAALIVICLIGTAIFLATSRSDQTGTVQSATWQTMVVIEQLGPVSHQDWQDQIPQDAQVGQCTDKVRTVQDSQPSGMKYNKVCGTPYTVDTGSGVGKVVQDCQFEVLDAYCDYTVQEWREVNQARQSGTNFSPAYAQPTLSANQRLGQQSIMYVVVFKTAKDQYEYQVANLEEFKRFSPGSHWTLSINGFGQIVGVEPAQ